MPLAYTIYYVVLYGSIFLMLKQWYLNILVAQVADNRGIKH